MLAAAPHGHAATPAAPAAGAGGCTIDIVLQTTPAFTQKLPCNFSNQTPSKSDHLTWSTRKNAAGHIVSLESGERTADSATLSVFDDRIPHTDSAGNSVWVPVAGHVYALDSASKYGWSAIVGVFPTPEDLAPVECQGGHFGNSLPPTPRPYVAGTTVQLNWTEVDASGMVSHGTVEARLSCAKVNLNGTRTPLGMIGGVTVKF